MASISHFGLLPRGACFPEWPSNVDEKYGVEVSLEWAMAFIWRIKQVTFSLKAEFEVGGAVGCSYSNTLNLAGSYNLKSSPPRSLTEKDLVCGRLGWYSDDEIQDISVEDAPDCAVVSFAAGIGFDGVSQILQFYNKNGRILAGGAFFGFDAFIATDQIFGASTLEEINTSGEGPTDFLEEVSAGNITYNLNIGSISVPIFAWRYATEIVTGDGDPAEQPIQSTATLDMSASTVTATEYWPYDPEDGGGPIYDSATGEQLRAFPAQ